MQLWEADFLYRFVKCQIDQLERPANAHLHAERQGRPDWVALTCYDLYRGRAAARR